MAPTKDAARVRSNQNGRLFLGGSQDLPSPEYWGAARLDSLQAQMPYGAFGKNHVVTAGERTIAGGVTTRMSDQNPLRDGTLGRSAPVDLLLAYGDCDDLVDLATLESAVVIEEALINNYQAGPLSTLSSGERMVIDEVYAFTAARWYEVLLPDRLPAVAPPPSATGNLVAAAVDRQGEFYLLEADLSGANHVLTLHYTWQGAWLSFAAGTYAAQTRYQMLASAGRLLFSTGAGVYCLSVPGLRARMTLTPYPVAPPDLAPATVVSLLRHRQGVLLFLANGYIWLLPDRSETVRIFDLSAGTVSRGLVGDDGQSYGWVGSQGLVTMDRMGRRRITTLPVTHGTVRSVRMGETADNLLLGSQIGNLYVSRDRGASWVQSFSFGVVLDQIVWASRHVGYAVVSAPSAGQELWMTVSAGRRWKRIAHRSGSFELPALCALEEGGVCAAGRSGTGGVGASVKSACWLISVTEQAVASSR